MMKRLFLYIISSFLAVAISFNVSTAEEPKKSDIWRPVTPGPFTTLTAVINEKNQLSFQPLYFFNIARGIFTSDGHYKNIQSRDYKYNQLVQLYISYGVTDRFEIDAQPSWQMNNFKAGPVSAESTGYSDTKLFARYDFFNETKWIPESVFTFSVKLPTGKYQKPDDGRLESDIIDTGSTDYYYGLSLTKGIKPLLMHLDLFYVNSPSPVMVDGIKTKYNDTFIVNGAVEWIIYKKFSLLGELLWQSQGDRKEDGCWAVSTAQKSLVFSTGLGWSEKSWQVLFGYQRTLAGVNADANDTIAMTAIINF